MQTHKLKRYNPKTILIEDCVAKEPLARHVRKNLPNVETHIFRTPIESQIADLGLSKGKETFVLAKNPGRYFKSCPGSGGSLCCGYFILNTASNCNFDCTYCFLQGYLNTSPLIQYADTNAMFAELNGIFETHSDTPIRVGTGELSDSLSLDPITGLSTLLIPYFA
ncbi:MAG: hypothetical protein Q8Q33_00990, partial [Chlamydiota bacterium]|nr:hypothetical protein [Chlamydiota bacterium]